MKLSRSSFINLLYAARHFLNDYDQVRTPEEDCCWNVLWKWQQSGFQKAVVERIEYKIKLEPEQAAALRWAFGDPGSTDARIFSTVHQLTTKPPKQTQKIGLLK